MTYRDGLSNPFEYNVIGIVTGSASAVRFPSGSCQLVRFEAYSSNIGSFFIGNDQNRCVWELDAGYDTGWFGIDDMNDLWYRNPSGTSDYLAWWIQK